MAKGCEKEIQANAAVEVQLRNKKIFLWVFPTIDSTTWEATGTAGNIE